MKQNRISSRLATMLITMCVSTSIMAQASKVKTTDKDLIGVWVMESMQYEGQKKFECGDNYGSIKVYRANGEYACAELAADGDGAAYVLPHEYGTYTFKNGKYTECGRNGTVILTDKTHFEGPWKNRYDKWVKVSNMPAKLVDYIVNKCKLQNDPKDIQNLIKKHILNKPQKSKK